MPGLIQYFFYLKDNSVSMLSEYLNNMAEKFKVGVSLFDNFDNLVENYESMYPVTFNTGDEISIDGKLLIVKERKTYATKILVRLSIKNIEIEIEGRTKDKVMKYNIYTKISNFIDVKTEIRKKLLNVEYLPVDMNKDYECQQ